MMESSLVGSPNMLGHGTCTAVAAAAGSAGGEGGLTRLAPAGAEQRQPTAKQMCHTAVAWAEQGQGRAGTTAARLLSAGKQNNTGAAAAPA